MGKPKDKHKIPISDEKIKKAEQPSGSGGAPPEENEHQKPKEEEDDEALEKEYQSVCTLCCMFITVIVTMFITLPGGYEDANGKIGCPKISNVPQTNVFYVSAALGSMFSFAIVFLKASHPRVKHYRNMRGWVRNGLRVASLGTLTAFVTLVDIMLREIPSNRLWTGGICFCVLCFYLWCSKLARKA